MVAAVLEDTRVAIADLARIRRELGPQVTAVLAEESATLDPAALATLEAVKAWMDAPPPEEPEATTVARALGCLLAGEAAFQAVPLEDLVTPATLGTWRAALDDVTQRATLMALAQHCGVEIPAVVPLAGGSVGVRLFWRHPEQLEAVEVRIPGRPLMPQDHMFIVVHVAGLGWRISAITNPVASERAAAN